MPIPGFDSIGDAVAFNNTKAFGDAGANLALQASQQFSAHNNRMNTLSESIQAAWATRMTEPDPIESAATQKILTGREGQSISETLALAQVLAKTAQTTPPPTA